MKEAHCLLTCVFALALSLCGCSRLPELTPPAETPCAKEAGCCQRPFPAKPWRAVHTLHISGPFGHENSVLGVTVVEPVSRRIRAVVLSLEGVTLFDATSRAGETTVHRAIPPLDRKGFSEGLMHDVSLMFLTPQGTLAQTGRNKEGRLVCRWRDQPGGATDVIFDGPDKWQIVRYEDARTVRCELEATALPGKPLATRTCFSYRGVPGYSLDLGLLEVESPAESEDLFSP